MKTLAEGATRKSAEKPQAVAQEPLATIADSETQDYWTGFNVILHRQFADAQESLDFFHWRNDQYFAYIERMPVAGFDGKACCRLTEPFA